MFFNDTGTWENGVWFFWFFFHSLWTRLSFFLAILVDNPRVEVWVSGFLGWEFLSSSLSLGRKLALFSKRFERVFTPFFCLFTLPFLSLSISLSPVSFDFPLSNSTSSASHPRAVGVPFLHAWAPSSAGSKPPPPAYLRYSFSYVFRSYVAPTGIHRWESQDHLPR